jgi:GTP-binding protein
MNDGTDHGSQPDPLAGRGEAIRLLFARPWEFVRGMTDASDLPPLAGTIEIAFAGRSNVGKSSLINALTGRNSLVRVSRTPGRTQELVFFTGDPVFTLVDMPGYGYAEAPRDKVKAWTELIHAYLRGRANLARVYVLIDARHGLKDTDAASLDVLSESAVSHQIVLTKADQVKRADLQDRIAATQTALAGRPAAFPHVLATSSRSGDGIPDLRAAIARLRAERAA